MITGGGELMEHIRPGNPDGDVTEGALGSYRGDFEHLNIRNAQPGFTYEYGPLRGGKLNRYIMKGWEVCTEKNGPERLGYHMNVHAQHTGPDGMISYMDTVLLRIPNEKYREIMEARVAYNKAILEGEQFRFLDNPGAGEPTHNEQGQPIRYVAAGHRTEFR